MSVKSLLQDFIPISSNLNLMMEEQSFLENICRFARLSSCVRGELAFELTILTRKHGKIFVQNIDNYESIVSKKDLGRVNCVVTLNSLKIQDEEFRLVVDFDHNHNMYLVNIKKLFLQTPVLVTNLELEIPHFPHSKSSRKSIYSKSPTKSPYGLLDMIQEEQEDNCNTFSDLFGNAFDNSFDNSLDDNFDDKFGNSLGKVVVDDDAIETINTIKDQHCCQKCMKQIYTYPPSAVSSNGPDFDFSTGRITSAVVERCWELTRQQGIHITHVEDMKCYCNDHNGIHSLARSFGTCAKCCAKSTYYVQLPNLNFRGWLCDEHALKISEDVEHVSSLTNCIIYRCIVK